jgi:subtilisin family serine protease
MRRLVLLGLLGLGVSACKEPEPIDTGPQELPLCPELVVEEQGLSSSTALGSASSALTAAPAPEAPQPMLVRFRKQSGVRSAAALRQREDKVLQLGARLKYHWPSLDTLALSLTPEEQARLARDPEVLSISPDRPVHALGASARVPVSALLGAPGALDSTVNEYTWAVRMTQANAVWDANNDGVLDPGAPNGSGITVCVIDSGIDPDHAELKAVYAGGKDYIDGDDMPLDKDSKGAWGGGHGTHVAGTIAAQLGSGGQVDPNDPGLSPKGMVGLAPGVRLLIARVLDEHGDGKVSDVIEALRWCRLQKANIVSLSLGSSSPDEVERQAFQEAWDAGVLSIAASGNGGELATPESKIYPAAYPSVIAVGAVDFQEKHPKFSQGGEHLSLVAPGVSIYSTYPTGRSPYANLVAGGTFYKSSALDFVPYEEYEGKLIDCGLGTGLRSCSGATCEGFVAYVDRGDIRFNEKVKNVRSQGARAVIIGNNDPEDDEALGFTLGSAAQWPPVTAVPTTIVPAIRAQFGNTVRVGIHGSDYAYSTGTSMATPHVSGVAALVWSARPKLTNAQVRSLLERTAKRLADPGDPATNEEKDLVFGWGLVQAKAAVDKAIEENPGL